MTSISDNLQQLKQELNYLQNGQQTVKLIAVSKMFPIPAIMAAVAAGQNTFGENYPQELANKAQQLSHLKLEWHFIGHFQSNKAKLLAHHAAWIHTLTTLDQATKLNKLRPAHLPPLQVLIQVNISHEQTKHGLSSFQEILKLARQIVHLPQLHLRGLMGMASNSADQDSITTQFQSLATYLSQLQQSGLAVDQLSMGMSNDYALAIKSGATLLRIGSKIFGARV